MKMTSTFPSKKQINRLIILSPGGQRFFLLLFFLIFFVTTMLKAQENNQMVRIAKITVDTAQLENYKKALQLQMETAIKEEPGVLSYHAVADKLHPNQITILEIYADKAAYLKHTQTAHFFTYKQTVKEMVLALELIDVNTVAAAHKSNLN